MPSPASDNAGAGYAGLQQPGTPLSEFGAIAFIVQSMIGKMATATIVKVKAVTNAGGVEPVGYVDIQPMIKQLDGAGNAYDHGVIYNCPYLRMQGGTDAIILDPKVGDLGIAIFASSDTSSLAANSTAAQGVAYRGSNPGSRRRFDWADALYIGGLLNGTPEQYVQFSAAGIKINSPVMVHVHAPTTFVQTETAVIQASESVAIETGEMTVDVDGDLGVTAGGDVGVTAGGAATLAGATAGVSGATVVIGGATSINLVSPTLQYNGTPFDPTSGVSGLPNPPPADTPSMVPGDVVFDAPNDTTMLLKRRGSDGLVYGFQFDLGLIP